MLDVLELDELLRFLKALVRYHVEHCVQLWSALLKTSFQGFLHSGKRRWAAQ